MPFTWLTQVRVMGVFRKSAGIPGVAVLVFAKRDEQAQVRL